MQILSDLHSRSCRAIARCNSHLVDLVDISQDPFLLSVSSAKDFTSFAAQTEAKLSSSGHVAENISTCRSVLTWLRISLARRDATAIQKHV